MTPLVLCYHAVSDDWPDDLAVRGVDFERQLRMLLARRFRPVSAREAVGGHGRLLHVTFDDAYRTLTTNAVPVLERLGVRATVFACSGYARDGRPLDVPELSQQLSAHPREMETLTWDGLRELADRGVEIGSHTVSHPHLPELSDDALRRELEDSRREIEDELRRPCGYLAYPYGHDDPRVHEAVARAGYAAAFSLVANPGAERRNRFALPRVDLYRKDGGLRAIAKTSSLRPALGRAARTLGLAGAARA
jgi:peptidoglycan/xylan/chitin deacetylase (PgdA/CDA1 family)